MSIGSLLTELVAKIDGATGAILLEADGEAVQCYPENGSERLRLRGAYIAVVVKSCRGTAIRMNPSDLVCVTLKYAGSSFVAREINHDCLVVVEMGPSANTAQAVFALKSTAERLRIEID